MVSRPMQKRNKQVASKTLTAMNDLGKEALSILDAPPVTVKRIENMIRYDVNPSDLSKWRNEGWQTVHYQFVNNDRDLPVLAVVMERVVEVSPEPVEPTATDDMPEEKASPLNPPASQGEEEIVGVPSVFEKLMQGNPIFAALCADGIDAVTETMNEQVVGAVYDAMQAVDVNVQTTRFESRLLNAGSVSVEKEQTIEVIQ